MKPFISNPQVPLWTHGFPSWVLRMTATVWLALFALSPIRAEHIYHPDEGVVSYASQSGASLEAATSSFLLAGRLIVAVPPGGSNTNPIGDTIELCQEDLAMVLGDVSFDVVPAPAFAGVTQNSYMVYTLYDVSITDPNGFILQTNLSPLPDQVYTGAVGINLVQNIQDAILIFDPNNFTQPVDIRYSVKAELYDAFTMQPIQIVIPDTVHVDYRIWPSPEVEIVNPNGKVACSGDPIPVSSNVNFNVTNSGSYSWTIVSADPGISGSFAQPLSASTDFRGYVNNNVIPPGGSGEVVIMLTFSDGNGCMHFDTDTLEFVRSAGSLTCNDQVNITLDDDCMAQVLPDDVLEGTYTRYDFFDVVIFDRSRNIGDIVTGAEIGKNLQVRVIDQCSGSYCWGELKVEDKWAPDLECRTSMPITTYSGTLDAADGKYHRTATFVEGQNPNTCILTNLGTEFYYEYITFDVTMAGDYEFTMINTNIADAFGAVYTGSFDPANPCMNLLTASDDNNAGILGPQFSLTLSPGTYVLVATTFFPNITGTYQWNIIGPPLGNGQFAQVVQAASDTITVSCNVDLVDVPKPTAIDNCEGVVNPELIGETFTDFGCDRSDFTVRIVERTYRAKDSWGNTSPPCKQIIKFVGRYADEIVFPGDYDGIANPALDCTDPMSAAHPDLLGWPTIDGIELDNVNFCKFNLSYEDHLIPVCGDSKKILRQWTVLDWCAPLSPGVNPLTHTQLIKFMDSTPPDFSCPDPFVASTDYEDCTATVFFQPISATDDCSGVNYQIATPYGVLHTNGGFIPDFPIGTYDVEYTLTDGCGNPSSCVSQVTVEDQIEPVAVCVEYLTVSLTTSQRADVYATSFDAGSYDNCCIDRYEVKRMSEPDSDFRPKITFTCAEAGDSVQVVVRVWDCYDNYNECMVWVDVADKLAPFLACPSRVTISCTADYTDLSLTGNATGTDNCGISVLNYTDSLMLDRCGVGQILRTFRATDSNGNSRTCTQTILVENDNPFNGNLIEWPRDTTFVNDCGRGLDPTDLPVGYDFPTYPDTFCADMMFRYEDEQYDASPPACFKILRRWTIIDWCTYDSNNPTGGGRWTKVQTIKVTDNQGPDMTCPDSLVFYAGPNCRADVVIDTPAVMDCSPDLTFTLSGDLSGQLGTFFDVPVGTYDVTLTGTDGCRNVSTCSFPVIVKDTTMPSPICKTVIAVLDNNGEVLVWASDLDASSYDNCTDNDDLIFSFSPDTSETSRLFTCADTVKPKVVEVWVTDQYGNQDYCIDTVVLQDNNPPACNPRPYIAGGISKDDGQGVQDVTVMVSGPNGGRNNTDQHGTFLIEDLQAGGDYTIVPEKLDDPLNGVSTYDLVLIAQHILQVEVLTSPYQLLAADVNNSGSVTTLDLVELRRLILRVDTDFRRNTSWRFIRTDYQFPDPGNPWATPIPEYYSVNNLNQSMDNVTFHAIKIGDINGNARANNAVAVDVRSTVDQLYFVPEIVSEANGSFLVHFRSPNFRGVLGYQFTLGFDEAEVALDGVVPGTLADESHFGFTFTDAGKLTTSWNSSVPVNAGPDEVLFSLRFERGSDRVDNPGLTLDGSLTSAEAYREDAELLDIGLLPYEGSLDGGNKVLSFQLYQNEPNPFSDQTVIRFMLPEACQASLRIVDVSGKLLYELTDHYGAGMHELNLNKSDIGQEGVLYYQLQTNKNSGIRKMILIE